VLFVVWGYIDRPNIPETLKAVIDVLAFVVPTLFLAAEVGLCVLLRSRLGMIGWMGMALAVYAWGWSVVGAIVGEEWPDYLPSWLLFMLTGLTLMGVATVRSGWSRGTGAVVLATGVFGWVYNLTDSGAVLEARSVHIGFGLLFSLGWVVLGWGSWRRALSEPPDRRQAANFGELSVKKGRSRMLRNTKARRSGRLPN
jgi:hypothetical protein